MLDINKIFYYNNSGTYCLQLDGYKWCDDNPETYTEEIFVAGDIVSMELDFDLKQLIYSKNGNNLGIAYDNIDIEENKKYKMAVRMSDTGNEIELMDFKCFKWR